MRRFLKIILGLTAALISSEVAAQDAASSAAQIIADIYEQFTEESETEIDFSNFYDDLIFLSENPINLNKTSKEELDKLQFLSDVQIDNILYYLYRNAPILTIYELQLIDGLDMTDIRRMLHFVTPGEAAPKSREIVWKDVFKFGKNELFLRFDKTLEKKEGFRLMPANADKAAVTNARKYMGEPFYNHLKYRYHYRDRVQFGVTAEKDDGEPFRGKHNTGYDFYSAHFEIRNFGKVKTLVLGDYRANFGQGLVMRTDFSMGKSSYVMQVSPRSTGLKKFSSTAESGFFRGAGAVVSLGKVDFTAFYSNRMLDADTTVGGQITSVDETGLHRTVSDLRKKHTVNQQVVGGNASFMNNWFQVGATVVYTWLDHDLQPRDAAYNHFYFRGKNQWAGSANYRARLHKLNFFGETAFTDNFAVATINGLNFNPVSRVGLVALHRHFAKEYDAFFARTFSETSRVNNESGFYIGAEVRPVRYWKVSAYADSYRFPWSKFGADAPSVGKDFLVQIDFFPKRNVAMYLRFKYEEKTRNYSDTLTTMCVPLPQPRWQARYQLNYAFGRFSFRNQVDANGFSDGVNKPTFGFSAFQDVDCSFRKFPLHVNLRFHVFDAPNYENRVYTYEKDVLYAFSTPMNYGLGARYYLNMRYDAGNNLSVWLKLAQTAYADDRQTIGSGNEEIRGSRKTDFRFLIRWKF